MGYIGLGHWSDSDSAADFVFTVIETVTKLCKKELKDNGNTYNTNGAVNIALFAEEFLATHALQEGSDLYKILITTRDQIKEYLKTVKKQEEWRDKNMHVIAYQRLIKSLNKIIKRAY